MLNKSLSDVSLLYVEDEPLISLDAMSALETCGFQNIVCAYTLKAATSACDIREFDCAILDIRLERGVSSVELGKSLVKKGTMVILASGNGLDKEDLGHQGFSHFYIKPYDIHEIIAKIEETFGK